MWNLCRTPVHGIHSSTTEKVFTKGNIKRQSVILNWKFGKKDVIFWHTVNCLILGIIATVLFLALLF